MKSKETYQKVRLKPEFLDAIINAFRTNFGEMDHLWIFGSRVKLHERGGDIDLYVETYEADVEKVTKNRAKFVWDVCKKIGEQKIDVVLNLKSQNYHLPIYDEATKNGVKLV